MIINNNVLTTYTVKETHFMGRIIISQLTKHINNHSLSSLIDLKKLRGLFYIGSTRFRPSLLALYKYSSARAISSVMVSLGWLSTTPNEAVILLIN